MPTFVIIIIIAAGALALLGVILPLILTIFISRKIYLYHFFRDDPQKWGRVCSWEQNKEQVEMYEKGLEWFEANKQFKKDVHIVNREGMDLYGEYFDFGHDKAVLIHQGRTEACRYSYFFAPPYQKAGFNVLVIDPRAHGLSDGKYNTLGNKESGDIVEWCAFLHDEMAIKKIVLHGICIGSAAALYALTKDDCPDYIRGLVAEGMYADFYDSFKNHIIELKHPTFPVLQECDLWAKKYAGIPMKYGPKCVIVMYDKPLLMLHSAMDPYSLPDKAVKLFESCPSKSKRFKMFPTGQHSHLRAVYEKEYDEEIVSFLEEYKNEI
ncbi:MAG: alpha/beta fold hydrolase [Clostridia bacterium]|nr:alpha/beta fold hydrolase [Clostridia bacterium]